MCDLITKYLLSFAIKRNDLIYFLFQIHPVVLIILSSVRLVWSSFFSQLICAVWSIYIMNPVERSHRSWKRRRPWGALVSSPGKSARDHREERAAPGRAGSSGKDRIRLETSRLGQWSCSVVRFLAYDDRQHGGDFMRLAPDSGCVQRWLILGLPVRLTVRWRFSRITDDFCSR